MRDAITFLTVLSFGILRSIATITSYLLCLFVLWDVCNVLCVSALLPAFYLHVLYVSFLSSGSGRCVGVWVLFGVGKTWSFAFLCGIDALNCSCVCACWCCMCMCIRKYGEICNE